MKRGGGPSRFAGQSNASQPGGLGFEVTNGLAWAVQWRLGLQAGPVLAWPVCQAPAGRCASLAGLVLARCAGQAAPVPAAQRAIFCCSISVSVSVSLSVLMNFGFLRCFVFLVCLVMFRYVWLWSFIVAGIWLCLVILCYVRLCSVIFDDRWLGLVLVGYVWFCVVMFSYVWLCFVMFDSAWLC